MKRFAKDKQSNLLLYLNISDEEKSFITLIPGVNFIKLFPLLLTKDQSKLECLTPTNLFSLV